MFVSDKIIYLELQKTASNHIAGLMSKLLNGSRIGNHNRLPEDFAIDSRYVIGSIRDPFDWYVSLWAHGCDSKGGLRTRLTSYRFSDVRLRKHQSFPIRYIINNFIKPVKRWRKLYSSTLSPKTFREWLCLLLNSRRKYDLGECYASSSISTFAGLYTYRYMYLFSSYLPKILGKTICHLDDLKEYDQKNNVLDKTIYNEDLERSFIDVLRDCGIKLNENNISMIYQQKRTNVSERKREISYYYDSETIELVESKEQFIIDKYCYHSP